MNNNNWLCTWKWGSTSKTNLLNSSMIFGEKKVSGVENGRALKFCFVDVVYQMLFCATQWKCVGVFCFYREIGWAPTLKAKYTNFQNKNVIHKSRLCIFTWKKTWQTVEIKYVDVNIWKIDPRCQVLKPWQMRDEWICQIMVNAVERSDCQPSASTCARAMPYSLPHPPSRSRRSHGRLHRLPIKIVIILQIIIGCCFVTESNNKDLGKK